MPADAHEHVVHRPPDEPPPVTVYAKWRAIDTLPRKDSSHPIANNAAAHLYDVLVCPDEPLRIGLHVKLQALSPQAYRPPFLPADAPLFDTYDPHVEGNIVGVSLIGNHTVEFVVSNLCRWNPVAFVYIAVQYLPELTARLQLSETACHWLLHASLRTTRAVPLIHGAEITTHPAQAIEEYPTRFEYPEPVSETPWLQVWNLVRPQTTKPGTTLRPAAWSSSQPRM